MELLRVENLSKTYGKGEAAVRALRDVSFSMERGEFAAVVGESGSGKSTLLNCIGGLDAPTGGKVYLDGEDLFSMTENKRTIFRRQNIGFIGSKAFSGVSPPIPGVLYSFTSLFRRTPYFPGVSLNLLVFLVFTRFYWSSPLFTGVPYLNHQIFFKLHQLFLKLPITFIAMLDASMVAPYFQCYD